MITYSKSLWALPLLLRWYGSALPRTLPAALVSGVLTALLGTLCKRGLQEAWLHPFPYNAFSVIVSFILVFRGNHAWSRFWEGWTNVQIMGARWTDSALMLLTWDTSSLPVQPTEEDMQRAQHFAAALLHLLSLLHALACQGLRRDALLSNLRPHNSLEDAPPTDPAMLHSNDAPPANNTSVGQISWKDLFLLRGTPATIAKYNAIQPLPVIGSLSNDEWRALACINSSSPPNGKRSSGSSSGAHFGMSVDSACCMWHVPFMERPHIVMTWLQQLLVERQREGGLDVPAPILSRAYQELSDGMIGYEMCRKIASVPFPFPWAQFMLLLLLAFTFTLPLMVVAYIPNVPLAVVISVLSVTTYWAMNEVARDIEDPYMYEPNEVPLAHIQHNFNTVLLAVSTTRRPLSIPEELLLRGRDANVHGTAAAQEQPPVMPSVMTPPGQPMSPSARAKQHLRVEVPLDNAGSFRNGWHGLDVPIGRSPRDTDRASAAASAANKV